MAAKTHSFSKLFFVVSCVLILFFGPASGMFVNLDTQALAIQQNKSSVLGKNSLPLQSQSLVSDLLWNTFSGGSGYDEVFGIDTDSQGNVYVTGKSSASWGSPISPFAGGINGDAFVAKYDTKGTLLWNTFLGSSSGDHGTAIAIDVSGAVYLVGESSLTWGTPIRPKSSNTDIFAAKLDNSGVLQWNTFLGGSGIENGNGSSVVIDASGNIYVTGSSPSAWGTPIRAFSANLDGFVAKLDSNGILEWNTFLGGNGSDNSAGAFATGNVYITGTSSSTWGSPNQAFNGSWNAFVVALDGNGEILWNTFSGGSAVYGSDIVVSSNNLYITGSGSSWGTPITPFAGSTDAFIAKFDLDGMLLWNTFMGTNMDDSGLGIESATNGNVYAVGHSSAAWGKPIRQYSGGQDAFIAEVTSNGVLLWNSFFGSTGTDYGNAIAIGGNGYIYAAGSSDVTWGSPIQTYSGSTDGFIASLLGPFLNLPFHYTNFQDAAKGSNGGGGPGYVNSWFDHTNPGNIAADSNLTTWLGPYAGGGNIGQTNCNTPSGGLGIRCYNGHDGIDFRHISDAVLAAAPGTVFGIGYQASGFGNYLYIDHQNCYASFYAHLKTAPMVQNGDPVVDRQPIGIMGNTGLSLGGGGGTHLHFGLYYDPNCNGDFSDKIVVDPYGWSGTGLDPWATGPSRYLWKHSYDFAQQPITNSGGSASTLSGNLAVNVPAGAVVSPVTLELWDTPPIAGTSATLRSTGYSFWLRVLEWLTVGDSLAFMASAETNSFDVPVTVSVHYDPSLMPHLDTSQLTIRQWDDASQMWLALPTTFDTINQQASAQTSQPGHFDMQAPLVCPADSLEPNDNYDGASVVQTNGNSVNNLFDIVQDEDWFQFDAIAGINYTIKTVNLSVGMDTILELYDTDGLILLTSDDNGGGGKASSLTWHAPNTGIFFVRVKQAPGSVYGCMASYQLNVVESLAYSLIWSDEFSGSSVNTSDWSFEVGGGGWGNNELQYYTNGANASVASGELIIQARKENMSGYQYTSTRMNTKEKHEFKYGKIEARMKLPLGQGLWPAFWMLGSSYPSTPWPATGEIDIIEHKNNDDYVYGAVHWDDNGINPPASFSCPPNGGPIPNISVDEYHTYSIEWDPNYIRWFVDGIQYCEILIQNTPSNNMEEFRQPYFILLNLAVGGNFPGAPDGTTPFPANMYVDYVRVYQTLVTISGNVGIGGVTLNYTDDSTLKTVSADGNGDYSIAVPYGWTGTITPSKSGHVFSPASLPFSDIQTDHPDQNFSAVTWPAWSGGVSLTSDQPVAAVGRPHVGAEVMTYNGSGSGSTTQYIPMLFKNAFGGSYNAALYVQNINETSSANISISYYDSTGALTCSVTGETLTPLSSKGYWLPTVACLPVGWVGGAVVTSDKPVVAVGRPHIGNQVTTYVGFASGSPNMYVPMLFKNAFAGGSYNAALYIQNTDPALAATVDIDFYDSDGSLTCSLTGDSIAARATKGYWMPSIACIPVDWVGGAVIRADQNIVAVGRPHIGTQVTTYNGFSAGQTELRVPMLFKKAFAGGSYNAALYIQNTDSSLAATVDIDFYDSNGSLTCSLTGETIAALATKGYWMPSVACLPTGWVGGAVISANRDVVAVGRPHVGSEVATYGGFATGSPKMYLPMLFKDAFGGSYDSAVYVQNTSGSDSANVTFKFYDTLGNLSCLKNTSIPAGATIGYWLPSLTCTP